MRKYMFFSAFLFAAFSLWLLTKELEPFLRETALMTPMLTTSEFATEMISQPCGALFWLASLLQSIMIWRYIGAALLTIVLVLLAFAVKYAFRISDEWAGIAWLPSLALLLSYTQTGYMLYLLKMPGVAFTWPLGILIAVLLLCLWRLATENHSLPYRGLWNQPWLRIPLLGVLLLLLISIFYWLIGVFALIAVVLVVLTSLKSQALTKTRIATSVFLVIVIAVVPQLLYAMGFIRLRHEAIYMSGIPDYQWNDDERYLFYPLIFTVVFLFVLALLKPIKSSKEKQAKEKKNMKFMVGLVASAILFVGGCWLVWQHSFRDQNFLSILKMKESVEKGDWEGVLTLSRANDTEPTRAQVCLTRLALYKLGRMGDELFTYPDGAATYQSPRTFPYLRLMIGRLLYYHYGKVNYSYRWAMEDMVEYGMRPDYIKYMLMAAETNGEKALAKKYRDALERMIGMKERVIAPTSNTQPEKKGEPFELMNYEDILDGDAGLIEFYLLNSFAMTEGGSREMVELSMMNNLITKNLESFWPRFFKLLPTWQGHIPRHYQEAALMIAQLTGRKDLLTNIAIDADVSARFERLVTASAQNGDNDYNKIALKGEFGDTYWYYYFFVEGLKTT